jgi:hypothetical protein
MIDWKHLITHNGLKSTWIIILRDLIQLPYRHIEYVVLACPLSEPIAEFESKLVVEIRPFLKIDLGYVSQEFLPSEANMCYRRLKMGHRGLVATSNSSTVGYCWLCTDDDLERVDLRMLPGDILITDSFTSPNVRGRGVHTQIAVAALRYAKELKFKRLIMYIEINNAPSLAVWQKKMRGEPIGHIDFKRIGFWRRTRLS